MILYGDLPPVGNRISLKTNAECSLEAKLGENQYWVDSGTSALALALLDAKASFPEIAKPRAIIPGYCCPDLVAACIYAGVEVVVVDISPADPSYDMEQLRLNLDSNVIAIIAVNFLGISERLSELRELIAQLNLRTRLIEDNAQWFPALASDMEFQSDYVTFSFGRGKPMSLLGGGLLLSKAPIAASVSDCIKESGSSPWKIKLKIILYNWLLKPQLYQLLNRNPWIRLGETRYVPLEKIESLDGYRRSLLNANFVRYSAGKNNLSNSIDVVVVHRGLQCLDRRCVVRQKQFLRYPLLCPDNLKRDKLLKQLSEAGLGASPMYAKAIDQIEGVDGLIIISNPLTNAKDFAGRFMTLPVHAQVADAYRDRMLTLLSSS